MKQLDEIIFDAICEDAALMEYIGGRDHVVSTCFENPPAEKDNTPTPNIIITDDGFQNQPEDKDCVWESEDDRVQVGVDVAADSPKEVKMLIRMVRKAVRNYIVSMHAMGEYIPELKTITSDGISWDWMKPCYYQKIVYNCVTNADIDNEQD